MDKELNDADLPTEPEPAHWQHKKLYDSMEEAP